MNNRIEKLGLALRGNIGEAEDACRKLCEIAEKAALEVLIALGSHKDAWKRRLAAKYLGIHPYCTHAHANLLTLLQDKNRYVVSMAGESLYSIYHNRSSFVNHEKIHTLLKIMECNVPYIKIASARVLTCCITNPAVYQRFLSLLESKIPELKFIAIEVIAGCINPENFKRFMNIWEDMNEDYAIRMRALLAADGLVSLQNWKKLFAIYQQEDTCKILACELARRFRSPENIPYILDLTKHEDLTVRNSAYETLRILRHKISQEPYNEKKYPWMFIDINQNRNYVLCENQEINDRLSAILIETRKFFHGHHKEWQYYKDYYARQLITEMEINPWLGPRMLALKDRLVSMLVFRAYELQKILKNTS